MIANEQRYIDAMQADEELRTVRKAMYSAIAKYRYTYNFSWLGRPIIQLPEDILMIQELIWEVKPDLVIETGVAHGGSLVLSASILELIGEGDVVGIDIEIRSHNRQALDAHPLRPRITLVEGSSTNNEVIHKVRLLAKDKKRVMVFLDSNHTHEHVLAELRIYSPLVTKGSYMVVFDTGIEDVDEVEGNPERPWGKGDNPKTAVWEFLRSNNRFEIDKERERRLMATVAPDGYLRCTKS